MGNEREPFDSTVCFSMFGSWVESIMTLETESDRHSLAYMLFKSIALYSLYDEDPNFDSVSRNPEVLKAIWPMIAKEIDLSINRRKRGFLKSGPSELQKEIIDLHKAYPKLSYRQLATAVDTSKSNIHRTLQRFCKTQEDDIEK